MSELEREEGMGSESGGPDEGGGLGGALEDDDFDAGPGGEPGGVEDEDRGVGTENESSGGEDGGW